MFKQVVADAEARQNELIHENSSLRQLLCEVHGQILSFLEDQADVLETPTPVNNTDRFQVGEPLLDCVAFKPNFILFTARLQIIYLPLCLLYSARFSIKDARHTHSP